MAYTIVKSDGTVLTTIADGTINTTSTSLGLPGRNYPGYGQTLDTNFVHILESFADSAPPQNPIRGQLWFNTNTSTLCVCPVNAAPNAAAWLTLTSTASGGNTSFGNIDVTGNVNTSNVNAANNVTVGNLLSTFDLTVSNLATIGNSTTTNANIGTTTTANITAGSQSTNGSLTGVWTANGAGTANGVAGTAMWVTGGNLVITGAGSIGLKVDNLMFANGTNLFAAGGAYSNANVAAYLPTYVGNVGAVAGASAFNGNVISTGADLNTGTVTGNWSFTAGSRLIVTNANISTLNSNSIVNAGNVTSGNVYANSGTVGASLLTGTLTTGAQPNISSVANLTSSGFFIRSVGAGISAAGTTQGAATQLTKEFNIVTTISAGVSDGVKLPTAVAGLAVTIVNTSTANLQVYPDTGARINGLSVNANYTQVGPNVALQFVAANATNWYTLSSVYA